MASPQIEDGYTRIANELLENILQFGFSKRELSLMIALTRKTYGYGKKEDDITVTQLAGCAGLRRQGASAGLADLVAIGAVLKRDGRHGYMLKINKNYENWNRPKTGRVPKQDADRPKTGRQTVPKRDTQKTTQKKTPKEKQAKENLFAIWYRSWPNKKARGQAAKAWEKLNPDRSQTAKLIRAVRRESRWRFAMNAADEFVPEWKNPATWLNGQCWDDELIYPKPGDGNGKNSRGYSARSAVERSEDGIRGYLEQQAGTH